MTDAVQKLLDVLEASVSPAWGPKPGDYAELVDENDEASGVRICRQDGTLVMLMPRSVWDSLRRDT